MTTQELLSYDKYIVAFSGGKDSTACFLHLLENGVPREKIELWHHLIDGDAMRDPTFMDWEVTEDYCRQFAKAFGVPIYFSWKHGGFKREMLRQNTPTAPISFQVPSSETYGRNGVSGRMSSNGNYSAWLTVGGEGPNGTRMKFPQVSPDLSVRWCSAYLKIDVCSMAIRNQERFKGIKTLLISGERGEESKARSNYAILEPDRSDLRNGKKFQRHVDHYRPIRDCKESEVWALIEKYKVVVHPCYYMGWGRCSCKFCIFGNADQFASAFDVSPKQGNVLTAWEEVFDTTIKRDCSLKVLVQRGKVYAHITPELKALATSHTYYGEILTDNWTLPAGAYGESCGPM